MDCFGIKVIKLDGTYYRVNKGKNGRLILIPSDFRDLDTDEEFINSCIDKVLKEEEHNEQFSSK